MPRSECDSWVVCLICLWVVLWWTGDLSRVYLTSRPMTVDIGSSSLRSWIGLGYIKWMDGWIKINMPDKKWDMETYCSFTLPPVDLSPGLQIRGLFWYTDTFNISEFCFSLFENIYTTVNISILLYLLTARVAANMDKSHGLYLFLAIVLHQHIWFSLFWCLQCVNVFYAT